MKDLNAFLSKEYLKYSDSEGRLYLAQLQEKSRYARFLEEITKRVDNISPELKKEMLDLVNETYEHCYKGMAKAVKNASDTEQVAEMLSDSMVRPEVLQQAVNNNISKLTLPTVLEKNRQEVIYQIQQVLNIGLMNGDRYDTMAKKIVERLDVSYGKATRIVRTESHRNVEAGLMDGAESVSSAFDGSDLIYAATWQTMGDERVRPQRRVKTSKGWKTTYSKNGANHIKMNGVTVKVGDKFQLETGVYAKYPSGSGVARHDCNCRCFLEYNLMTIEEFEKATGKPVYVRSVHGSTKQSMNDNGIADLDLQRTTDAKQFDTSIKAAIKSQPVGGCVDAHPIDELKDYKLFLASNGMAGVAVKPDGDITAVFKNYEYKQRGAVNDLIITARANGGVKMDCYGIGLVNMYEKCGYVPVARVPFNADYVSDPYLLQTRPDVYVMMKNADALETVIEKNAAKAYKLSLQEKLDNLPTYEDYDEALSYRDRLLRDQESK